MKIVLKHVHDSVNDVTDKNQLCCNSWFDCLENVSFYLTNRPREKQRTCLLQHQGILPGMRDISWIIMTTLSCKSNITITQYLSCEGTWRDCDAEV